MTERILGEPGPARKRRLGLLPLLMLVGAIMLLVVSSASGAFGTATIDENGPNDVPGQKDLNSQNVDDAGLPDVLGTQWNWDDLSTSGANTLDACSLLDSDGDGFANFAVCGTTKGGAANPPYSGTTTLYSCGDTRVDRCASQLAVLPATNGTDCDFALSPTDPFTPPTYTGKNAGNGQPNDTQATCEIFLDDFTIGGVELSDLELINTCSYPSQQPNSDPSDCVLVPRDAFLTIVKDAGGDTTTEFDCEVRVDTAGSNTQVLETITGGVTNSVTVGIIGGKANSVEELTLPASWEFVDAECTGGTNNGTLSGQKISGIVASTGSTVTCTFENALALVDPTLSTAPSVIPNDSATLAIDELGNGEGDLIFELFDNDECTGTALYSETIADIAADDTYETDNSGDPATDGYTIAADGLFYWKVHYEGDDRNNPATSDCVEIVDVDLTADSGS